MEKNQRFVEEKRKPALSVTAGRLLRSTTSPSSSLRSMPPPLVGEALAYRHVFERWRFAPLCTAAVRFCLAADVGFGAAGDDSEK